MVFIQMTEETVRSIPFVRKEDTNDPVIEDYYRHYAGGLYQIEGFSSWSGGYHPFLHDREVLITCKSCTTNEYHTQPVSIFTTVFGNPIIGNYYRYVDGGLYRIETFSSWSGADASSIKDKEPLIIYKGSKTGECWTQPVSRFTEVFEHPTKGKIPRFTKENMLEIDDSGFY